ncbi:heat shock protein DnaJ-like protein [Calothrix brevissima NIES-22]|nr:heat shock protein DnaJ-like protein [Calothrix brevissima NIES-22]
MNLDNLTICLRSIVDSMDFEQDEQLSSDILSICEYLESPYFRVAVFGPFNHGKSTLLNALLGTRALPIDIIPTTGAVISIKHGVELSTSINLRDGNQVSERGTDLLRRFAILDGDRRMRDDVLSVEMFCPHPLLERALEILDLPGTNDREEQDALVRSQLLKADLVIQVLDARKLMTLGEREGLRDWLLDRGIETVIFVINFLNLLEQQEQQEVRNRARYIAESFRANLPPGISNMYRVDALPALRAKLKGDTAEAHNSGIFAFESAIQSILESWASQTFQDLRFPRVLSVISQVKQTLYLKIQAAQTELQIASDSHNETVRSRQQSERKIKQSFKAFQKHQEPHDVLIKRGQLEMLQNLLSNLEPWLVGSKYETVTVPIRNSKVQKEKISENSSTISKTTRNSSKNPFDVFRTSKSVDKSKDG